MCLLQYWSAYNNYHEAVKYLTQNPKYRLQATNIAKQKGLLNDKRKKDRTKTKVSGTTCWETPKSIQNHLDGPVVEHYNKSIQYTDQNYFFVLFITLWLCILLESVIFLAIVEKYPEYCGVSGYFQIFYPFMVEISSEKKTCRYTWYTGEYCLMLITVVHDFSFGLEHYLVQI